MRAMTVVPGEGLQLTAPRNDVGPFSEGYDPQSKSLLGDFPQAFSHIGCTPSTDRRRTPVSHIRERRGTVGGAWHRYGSDARQGAVVGAVRTKGVATAEENVVIVRFTEAGEPDGRRS